MDVGPDEACQRVAVSGLPGKQVAVVSLSLERVLVMPNMFVFPNIFFDLSYYFLEFVLSIDDVVFMTKLPFHVGCHLLKSTATRFY